MMKRILFLISLLLVTGCLLVRAQVYKFDFTSDKKVKEGYTKVTPEEVVSKRWHNLFYILQFCYIFFWLCCFFLMHLATSCYIPIISGYK